MRFIKAAPLVAILAGTVALAGCDDQQTAQTEAPPPAAEAPAAPVAGDQQQAAQTEAPTPVEATPAEAAPAGAAPTGAAPAQTAQSDIAPPQTTLAPPPPPSAIFETGPDAMAPPDASATGAVLADAPFDAGVYTVENLTLELNENGDFTLMRADTGESVSGDFRIYGDMMTFSNVGVDTGGVFPMTCRVQPAEGGFTLTADGPSCNLFDGQTFTRG